jgi:hypothetical protein
MTNASNASDERKASARTFSGSKVRGELCYADGLAAQIVDADPQVVHCFGVWQLFYNIPDFF